MHQQSVVFSGLFDCFLGAASFPEHAVKRGDKLFGLKGPAAGALPRKSNILPSKARRADKQNLLEENARLVKQLAQSNAALFRLKKEYTSTLTSLQADHASLMQSLQVPDVFFLSRPLCAISLSTYPPFAYCPHHKHLSIDIFA